MNHEGEWRAVFPGITIIIFQLSLSIVAVLGRQGKWATPACVPWVIITDGM